MLNRIFISVYFEFVCFYLIKNLYLDSSENLWINRFSWLECGQLIYFSRTTDFFYLWPLITELMLKKSFQNFSLNWVYRNIPTITNWSWTRLLLKSSLHQRSSYFCSFIENVSVISCSLRTLSVTTQEPRNGPFLNIWIEGVFILRDLNRPWPYISVFSSIPKALFGSNSRSVIRASVRYSK